MTMILITLKVDAASIAADSICTSGDGILFGADGRAYEDHKLVVLPRFVLTSLGSLALRNYAQGVAHALADIDEAIERLPQILQDGFRVLGLRGAEGDTPKRHTVLVVGWSPTRAHMVCAAFERANDFAAELFGDAQQNSSTFWRSPDIPRAAFARIPDDRESLVAHAHATVDHWRGIDQSVPIGGLLRLAEITQESIVIRVAGNLGMPARRATTRSYETESDMSSKSIAALALALSACGGTADPVDIEGAQLVSNAATDVLSTNVATQTDTLTAHGTIVNASLATTTYTNATAGNVTLEITASSTRSLTGGTAAAAMGAKSYLETKLNAGAFLIAGQQPMVGTVAAGATTTWGDAYAASFTLAAGDTLSARLTYQVQGTDFGTGSQVVTTAATVRFAGIKR